MALRDDALTRLRADAAEIIGRYPKARSALLPLLHLVQSEEGYVSDDGIAFCAEALGISQTEVRGVATFYTMYAREPAAEYQVGVCTNTLCAIMGGDQIFKELAGHLGVDGEEAASPGGTTPPNPPGGKSGGDAHHDIRSPDGKVGLQRIECNAACDYAPVLMVNWEFFDNQTPESAKKLVDDLRAGNPVSPTRGPKRLCTWKEASRILAGFGDGQAADGPSAGPASLLGLKIARERGWQAPSPEPSPGGSGGSSPRTSDSGGDS